MCGAINERGCSFLASGAVEGKVREGENSMMLETIIQHSILLMFEYRRIFSFNSLKMKDPSVSLKMQTRSCQSLLVSEMECWLLILIQTILLVFVLFGVCEFCDDSDIGLFVCSLRIAGKWHYYSKSQAEM